MAVDTLYADATDETVGTGADSTGDNLVTDWDMLNAGKSYGHAYFDVYGEIGAGSTITACDIDFYITGFTRDSKKPATNYKYGASIFDGTAFRPIVDNVSYSGTPGWVSHAITTYLAAIGGGVGGSATCGAGYDTDIRFDVEEVSSPRSLTMSVASYENTGGGSAGDWAAFLTVTYTPAAGGTTKTVIICC